MAMKNELSILSNIFIYKHTQHFFKLTVIFAFNSLLTKQVTYQQKSTLNSYY